MTPPSRPRRGVLGVVGATASAALVAGIIVLGGNDPVEASGLSSFASCAELSEWGADAIAGQQVVFDQVGAPIDGAAPATTTAGVAATEGGDADAVAGEAVEDREDSATQAPEGDGTNVVVEGIDEPDLVERLGGDRALVVGGQTLAVVDLGAATIVDRAAVPWGAQVTYDSEAGVAWAVGTSDMGAVQVQRFAVTGDSLSADGSWSADGQLVSARRQGDELLVVATDWFESPVAIEDAFETVGSAIEAATREQAEPGFAGSGDSSTAGDGGGADPGSGSGGGTDQGSDVEGTADTLVTSPPPADAEGLPFAGQAVPCDEVLHPVGPAEPSATLLAVLPVSGPLQPLRSTEVVGSGSLVHVTADAAFLVTPSWDPADGSQSTGLHRFDLASLTHTGSGQVQGSLLNDFSMSEHDGFLRVAVTQGGGFIGRPMPVEGDGGIGAAIEDVAPMPDSAAGEVTETTGAGADPSAASTTSTTSTTSIDDGQGGTATTGTAVPPDALVGPTAEQAAAARVVQTTVPETTVPETTVPETTVPEATVPETTVPEASLPETTEPGAVPRTAVPETVVPEPVPETVLPPSTVVEPEPLPGDPLNEIVVFDTEGSLDIVGRTPRFGHPGETLYGVRFDGATAYAVTFLQTDPFYVVDLSDPAAPRITGELELPGFSSYLHPVSATEVVGFGPDESGRAAAKLFNVSDPGAPVLVDSIVLGDETPVAYDHHAFVDLGSGRFAVPASVWNGALMGGEEICGVAGCDGGRSYEVQSGVVVLAMTGGRLVEESRVFTSMVEPAVRVIPSDGGWGLLTSTEVVVVDADGTERATLAIG